MSSISSSTKLNKSAPVNVYKHTGRGGAGNYLKAPTVSSSSSSASIRSSTSTSSSHSGYSTGVGGAGNFHVSSPSFFRAFYKELHRKRSVVVVEPATVYHFGVGGAGNRKTE
jgi:hypothetical protein